MKALSLRLWMPAAILWIIFFFIAPTELIAQPAAGPCKCEDKADLINQLNMANAALNTIQQYLMTTKKTDLVNEIAPAPNSTGVTKGANVINAINQAISSVHQTGAHAGSVTTSTITCESKAEADTSCLKSLYELYGADRRDFCQREKVKQKLGENDDIMNFLPLNDYLFSLRDAYSHLIKEILNRLNAMPKSCRFNSWFGTIRYSYTRKDHKDQDRPQYNETHSFDDTLTLDGIIRLDGDYSFEYPSSWQVGGKNEEKKHSSGMLSCKGGLKQEGDKHKYETDFIFTWDKSGSKVGNTEVNIGELFETGKIPIQFKIPEITMTTNGYSKSSSKSDCPKPNGDFDGPPEPWNITIPLGSQKIPFNGSYLPGNPEKISGSDTIESGKTDTAVVIYNLYKFKR